MKLKLMLTCAMVAASLSLFACAPKQAALEVFCDEFYEQNHISQEVDVAVGDSFTVTLCSNPTTGFLWSESAQISDPTVLQQTDHKFVPPPERPEPVEGEAGKEVWTFKALKKGTSTISMEYSRPWEGGEKGAWTFLLTVVVK